MGFVWSEKARLSRLQHEMVEEKGGKNADIARIMIIETDEQLSEHVGVVVRLVTAVLLAFD